jgi:hypothetical protein
MSSCISAEEVLEGARRASTVGGVGSAGGSDLYRASGEDSGDVRESYHEQEDQDVPCSVEPSHRG